MGECIVLYHASSGRISLIFGQDPLHSDDGLTPYMWYSLLHMATCHISFASSHVFCFSLSHPSQNTCIIRSFPHNWLSTMHNMTLAWSLSFYHFGDKRADHCGNVRATLHQ